MKGYGYIKGECVKKFVLPKRKKCVEPNLKFGNFELQIDGRVVQYWCEEGWTLVPGDFESATCMLGNWSKPAPQCVRPGCEEIQESNFDQTRIKFEYSLMGALVTFECNSDYILQGERVLGCDGQYWNATVPECVEPVTANSWRVNSSNSALLISVHLALYSFAFR